MRDVLLLSHIQDPKEQALQPGVNKWCLLVPRETQHILAYDVSSWNKSEFNFCTHTAPKSTITQS